MITNTWLWFHEHALGVKHNNTNLYMTDLQLNNNYKGETLVKRFFQYVLPDSKVIYNGRYGFLNNLELDIFYPELSFAVEFDGIFHRIDEKQKERDTLKDQLCKSNGINLLRLTHPTSLLQKNCSYLISKYCGIKDINYIIRRLNYSLKMSMRHYKPKKTIRLSKRIKYLKFKQRMDFCHKIQKEETESNRRRMESKQKSQ